MDALFRMVAISLEVILLAALVGCLLTGLWLAVLDLGMKEKYKKALIVAFIASGSLMTVFFIAHLISFYPTLWRG